MKCINCLHKKTRVLNSRTSKKTAQTWRRRQCPQCAHEFTTYERVPLHDELKIQDGAGKCVSFNPGLLFADILKCFDHLPSEKQATNAFWLTQVIEDTLINQPGTSVSVETLHELSYAAVARFDTTAGLQFAAHHNMSHKYRQRKISK